MVVSFEKAVFAVLRDLGHPLKRAQRLRALLSQSRSSNILHSALSKAQNLSQFDPSECFPVISSLHDVKLMSSASLGAHTSGYQGMARMSIGSRFALVPIHIKRATDQKHMIMTQREIKVLSLL